MRVQTFFLIVDYGGNGDNRVFHGLSRVALERYKEWFLEEPTVYGISFGKEQ